MELSDAIHLVRLQLWALIYTQWKTELFTTRWWALVAIVIISYMLWWKFVEKRRLPEILLFGSLIAVSRVVMDDAGVSAGFWGYSVRIVPLSIMVFLNDLTVVPLAFMLVYQHTATWKKFFLWSVMTEGSIAFIFQPILSIFRIYHEYNWHSYYTFLIMIFIVTLSRSVVIGALHIAQKYQFATASDSLSQPTLQPAMKPIDNEDDEDEHR